MKILMLTENDPAGMGIAFTTAINEHTEHTCRLITLTEKYCFDFRTDIHLPTERDYPIIEKLLKESDIYHFHILSDESMQIGPFKVKDYIKGKKIVNHHHGHPDFRAHPDKYRIKYRDLKRKVLVSTPDLLLGLPSAYWMPNLVPINNPNYMPSDDLYEEFTIGHSPTRTDLKDTVALLEAAHKAGVRVDIIMNTPHRECLRRKRKCHVIFDHLQGYYGVSSLEGLSMGKPVIADLSDFVKLHIKDFAETEDLPWFCPMDGDHHMMYHSTSPIPGDFDGEHLKHLILSMQNNDKTKHHLIRSRQFMVNHWSDKKVVDRLIKFYEGL